MHAWTDGCMDGLMGGWVDACMHDGKHGMYEGFCFE